jgi:sugar phosphate isomerase/epimerase
MNRRTFLGTSLAAAAVSGFASPLSAQNRKIDRIGLQLYSVRDLMKQDMPGTLAKVAQIGFKEVEFAGLFDRSPKDVRAMLDQHGLTAPASHVDWVTIGKNLPGTLETAKILGQQYVIIPYLSDDDRKRPDVYKRLAELLNRAGEESLKAGIEIAYHQHGFEFVPSIDLAGQMPYDYLLANTDPKLVKMELDLCWIIAAEQDPIAYFNKYPGRFPLVHVKDWLKDGKPATAYAGALGPNTKFTGNMANVGQGSIDWKAIFAQAGKGGVEHFIVEHDNPKDPLVDLAGSFKYVQSLRF